MPPILLAIANVLIWTVFLLVLRGVLHVCAVSVAGALSRVVAVTVLFAWVCAGQGGWRRLRLRGAGRWLLLMGLVSCTVNFLMFGAYKWTPATNVAVLLRLDLPFVLLIGMVLGLERIGVAGLLTLPVMGVGVALLMQVQRMEFGGHAVGDAMVVVGAFGLAVNAFVIRHILRTLKEPVVAFYNSLISGLGFWILACAQGFPIPADVRRNPSVWLWLPAFGVVGALTLICYYTALRRLMVWKLRTYLLLSPLLVALAEWSIWDVRLTIAQWLGAALLLGGTGVLVVGKEKGSG